jgi:hypothetical protein
MRAINLGDKPGPEILSWPVARKQAGPPGRVDPIASGLLTGHQEVVNRILAMIHMDDRVMLNLHEDQDG